MKRHTLRNRAARTIPALFICLSILLASTPIALAGPAAIQDNPDAALPNGPDDAKFVEPDIQRLPFDGARADQVEQPAALPVEALSPDQGGPFYICGNADGATWTTINDIFQVVRQCRLTLPEAGHVYIVGNASMFASGGDVEGAFGLGIDSTTAMSDVDRRVSVYTSSTPNQPNKSVVASTMKPISAGTHTFYFLARRSAGSGFVALTAPTLSVIFIPSTAPYQVCANNLNGNWTTDSSANQIVLSCPNITASSGGFIFYAANTWLRRTNGAYEAVLWINVNGVYQDSTARWQNAYNDFSNGSDDTLAITGIYHVGAGSHSVEFLTRKRAGSGTVTLTDPNIAAFFFPDADPNVQTCSDLPGDSWYTSFSDFQFYRVCPLDGTTPRPMRITAPSVVFMSADGTSGSRSDADNQSFQLGVRLGINNEGGYGNTQRRVNVYDDGGDYSDTTFSASAVMGLRPGSYLFYGSGARISGPGEAVINRGGLTVLVFPLSLDRTIYLPFVAR